MLDLEDYGNWSSGSGKFDLVTRSGFEDILIRGWCFEKNQ